MPRKGRIQKRETLTDPKYNDWLVAKFVASMMTRGKKSVTERILYRTFDLLESRTKEDPLKVFKKAIENVKPSVEVKSRRVGGSTYQVPVEVRPERRQALAVRWIINFSRERSEKSMVERLSAELIDAYNGRGNAVKKREDTHKMAEANKAFSHYRW